MLQRDPRLQPAHDREPVDIVVDLLRPEHQRQVEPSLHPVGGPECQHADDRVALAVDPHLLADDAGVRAVRFAPERVGQDDDAVASGRALFLQEIAAGADH